VDILRAHQEALEAVVDEAAAAGRDRAAFAQENRDAHTSTSAAVARAEAAIATLSAQLTQARVENAGAIAAAQAGMAATERANTTLVRLVYVGGAVLVALTASLLYATLTLRGVDADAAMQAGRTFATPNAADHATGSP
jgi:hypothetical protein